MAPMTVVNAAMKARNLFNFKAAVSQLAWLMLAKTGGTLHSSEGSHRVPVAAVVPDRRTWPLWDHILQLCH
jgi:hypothetical protein